MRSRPAAPRLSAPGQVPAESYLLARRLYAHRRWTDAETLCRAILKRQTDHPGALTLLGIMLAQSKRTAEAAGFLGRAARLSPHDAAAQINHGNILRDLGRSADALACYRRAIALSPKSPDAHYNLGLALSDLQRFGEALASFEQSLTLAPRNPAAWNDHGAALHRLRRPEEALASFERAIALEPAYAEAHANRGASLRKLERFDDALASLERALAIKPELARAHFERGLALLALARLDEALASYDRAVALEPHSAEAHFDQGVTLTLLERFDEARESLERAIGLEPAHARAHRQLGNTLRKLRRFDEALACFGRSLAVEPQSAETHFDRGLTLVGCKRFADALESFDRALTLGRRDAAVHYYRGAVLQELNRAEEAIPSYAQALALDPRTPLLHGKCRHARMEMADWAGIETDRTAIGGAIERGEVAAPPFVLLSLLDAPALHRKATEFWVRDNFVPRIALPALPPRIRRDKIRIGYFSADFHDHPVTRLTAGLFEAHDRCGFELTAFSLGHDVRDELRARVEAACDRFLPVDGQSDTHVAALARELEIDIAVDLGGYTGDARPGIFALRAAPIQVSYLGYLGTMGCDFIDYLFADHVLVPPQSRQYYREKLAYLPSYQVNDCKRPMPHRAFSRAELGLPPTGFVFCSFNASYKITPETFDSWTRILCAVPDSVLFLLGSSAVTERNLRREAAARGVAPQRLIFGRTLQFADYLARYCAADLFLDTLPYNAGTTASDALWAGLPVLTLPGQSFAARMAASLLTAAGLPELIAANHADYERLAVALATDPRRFAALKQKLADNRPRCALFDTAASARNIEALYRQMYDRYLSALPPQHLFLPGDPHGQG